MLSSPKAIPKSIGIIGSGAIGIEFASFYKSLGSDVHVFEMQNNILPNEDIKVSEFLKKSLIKRGIKFSLNSKIIDVQENESFKLSCENIKTKKYHSLQF